MNGFMQLLGKMPTGLLVAVVIGGGIMLFASHDIATSLGLDEFRRVHSVYLGPAWLAAFSWLVARAVGAMDLRALVRRIQQHRARREVLAHLSEYERELLAAFIRRKEAVVHVPLMDRRRQNLVVHRVVYSPKGLVDMEIGLPLSINRWARRMLEKNPKFLGDAKGEGFVDPHALDRMWEERI